ncbi:DUF1178 family protein [Sutterella sp. AM11-39]|jgi:hypothetical protein|uniref:DUF1178 family protein n=1 Tax=Sutterella sp. AM11-39 TaxID=2292075 RepID=UPI000E54D096|nr:DUF1178 family protein [Sutterella sp. AM11-39]RHJ34498.1 DUF1178 family protein [Sutterella sp. AM11-39]
MPLKYFDFCCCNGHKFEGCFASLEDMQSQLADGLLRCPVCDTADVKKLPSASRLAAAKTDAKTREELRSKVEAAREALMTEIRKAAEKAEDVGENFAEESRRMKRGESKRRLVKGKCSLRQAQELIEEGIEVLPVPESSGKTLN